MKVSRRHKLDWTDMMVAIYMYCPPPPHFFWKLTDYFLHDFVHVYRLVLCLLNYKKFLFFQFHICPGLVMKPFQDDWTCRDADEHYLTVTLPHKLIQVNHK